MAIDKTVLKNTITHPVSARGRIFVPPKNTRRRLVRSRRPGKSINTRLLLLEKMFKNPVHTKSRADCLHNYSRKREKCTRIYDGRDENYVEKFVLQKSQRIQNGHR